MNIRLPVNLPVCLQAMGLASVILWGVNANAQALLDPTRPPALSAQTASDVHVESGPVLQSILIGRDRKLAIINGKTVVLNGKYEDATLVRVSETEVVLQRGQQLQTLKLFPDLQKKPVHEKAVSNKAGPLKSISSTAGTSNAGSSIARSPTEPIRPKRHSHE